MPTSPQARVTVNPFPARSRSTACRITCGLTNFGLTGRSTPPCPTRLGQRLLQLRILRLELPQPTRVGYCHPGVLGLPGCSTSARRSRICATALWSSPCLSLPQPPSASLSLPQPPSASLSLPQHPDDLLLGVSLRFHGSLPCGRLYADPVPVGGVTSVEHPRPETERSSRARSPS
jgi:hypothetical protein